AGSVILDPMGSTRRVATGADAPVAPRAPRSDAPRVIMIDEAVRARARASRRRQGLAATVADPVVLRRIATLIGSPASRGPVRDRVPDAVRVRRHLHPVDSRVEDGASPREPALFPLEDHIVA